MAAIPKEEAFCICIESTKKKKPNWFYWKTKVVNWNVQGFPSNFQEIIATSFMQPIIKEIEIKNFIFFFSDSPVIMRHNQKETNDIFETKYQLFVNNF